MRIHRRKSSFILLEVLVAISLLCLAMNTLVSIPSLWVHKELQILKDLEITRLEDIAYMELLEKLPQWLPSGSIATNQRLAAEHLIQLPSKVIHLGKDTEKPYCPCAILWLQKEIRGVQLLKCKILFEDYAKKIKSNKQFIYKIVIHEKEQKKMHNANRSVSEF